MRLPTQCDRSVLHEIFYFPWACKEGVNLADWLTPNRVTFHVVMHRVLVLEDLHREVGSQCMISLQLSQESQMLVDHYLTNLWLTLNIETHSQLWSRNISLILVKIYIKLIMLFASAHHWIEYVLVNWLCTFWLTFDQDTWVTVNVAYVKS